MLSRDARLGNSTLPERSFPLPMEGVRTVLLELVLKLLGRLAGADFTLDVLAFVGRSALRWGSKSVEICDDPLTCLFVTWPTLLFGTVVTLDAGTVKSNLKNGGS